MRPSMILIAGFGDHCFYDPGTNVGGGAWLETSKLNRVCLARASHWAFFDQPELLAERIIEAASAF